MVKHLKSPLLTKTPSSSRKRQQHFEPWPLRVEIFRVEPNVKNAAFSTNEIQSFSKTTQTTRIGDVLAPAIFATDQERARNRNQPFLEEGSTMEATNLRNPRTPYKVSDPAVGRSNRQFIHIAKASESRILQVRKIRNQIPRKNKARCRNS